MSARAKNPRGAGAGAVIVGALAIAGAGGLVGLGHSMTRDTPIRLTRAGDAAEATPPVTEANAPSDAPVTLYDPDAIPGMSPEGLLDAPVLPGTITLRRAKALFDEGAVFLDARHEGPFLAGHVEGALWMPAEEVPARWTELEPFAGQPMVIYCEGGDCDASHNTANRIELLGMGFDPADLIIMGLGYEEWARAGLPVEPGPGAAP